jgi:hypothetical protein
MAILVIRAEMSSKIIPWCPHKHEYTFHILVVKHPQGRDYGYILARKAVLLYHKIIDNSVV